MKKHLLFYLMMLSSFGAFSQSKTITGKVTGSDSKSAMPGVIVRIAGTQSGTQTNGDGTFKIEASAGDTLLVSFLGYTPQAVRIGAKGRYDIVLQVNAKSLDEIVVTSFGIQRDKKLLGYGISRVKSDELEKAPTTDVSNALAGRIAGVQVSGAGGGFAGSNITIRGYSTFTGSNQPLYVVDGVPIDNSGGDNSVNTGVITSSRIADINPDNIENIQVLKGAAATVLYGSRGASGVILITTKKGKQGHQVTFSSYNTVGIVSRFPKFQNQYAQGTDGKYVNNIAGSWGPLIQGQEVTDWFGNKVHLQAYPDNVSDILQHSFSTKDNISFSGANDKYDYRVSYGISTETGLVPENKLVRNNFAVNAGTNIAKNFRVSTSFSYINNNSDRTQSGNQGSNPLWRGIYTPRSYDLTNAPYEDEAGNQLWFAAEDQPYWAIQHVKHHSEVNRFFGDLNLKYDITDWLVADLKVGADVFNATTKGFDDKGIRGNGNTTSAGAGGMYDRSTLLRNLNSYFTISANRELSENLKLSATLGNEMLSYYRNTQRVTGYDIVLSGFDNIKNFITYNPSGSITKNRSVGLFGDVVLDYKDFLSVNVKARNDFTSTLAPGHRSIFYPALAISFVPTNAFPSLRSDFLTSAKIRANIGEVGKGASPYDIGTYYDKAGTADGYASTAVNFPFNGLAGYTYSGSAGNPELTPEFTREIALGLDLVFFNGRFTVDGSVYKRDTRNLIFSVPVPPSSGFGSYLTNAGKLSTKGIELLLVGIPVQSENFTWTTSLNFTKFKSIVGELAPGVTSLELGGFSSPDVRLVPGKEYGEIFSTAFQRDDQGRMLINDAGLPMETNYVIAVGNQNPKFTMGYNNSFDYKSFSLSFLLNLSYGGDILSRTIGDLRINGVAAVTAEYPRFNDDGTPTTPYLFEGVHPDGKPNTTKVSAQDYFGRNGKYAAWQGYVLDATFLKLREVNFTYRFSDKLFHNFIKGLSISAYSRNIFLWAPHYPDLDPEQNLLGIGNARGLEFGITPTPTNVGISIKATF